MSKTPSASPRRSVRWLRSLGRALRDGETYILFLLVMGVFCAPIWCGFALHRLVGWEWCGRLARGLMAFWTGPFLPIVPASLGMTFVLRQKLQKRLPPEESTPAPRPVSPEEKALCYSDLFWLFFFGSILGVVLEGLFCLVNTGKWESHVVSVWGWFNVLYGLGAAGLYAGAVKLRDKPVLVRCAILMGIATGLELACGLLLKYGFGMKAWDYSRQFMNLDGLVCLKFSLYWGLIAFVICRLAPHLRPALLRLRKRRYQVVCAWMSVLLVINFTLTAVALTRWSGRHYGVAPGSAFTAMIDRRANDQWMEHRFVEWRFLEPAVTPEEQ